MITSLFQDILSKVNRAQAAAQKDNDFIYHERVPNVSDLPAIGRAPVAKPTPVATEREYLFLRFQISKKLWIFGVFV